MRFRQFKNAALILTTIILFLFLLPSFSFTLGDNRYSWNGIDFSAFGFDPKLANFQKGAGIYPDRQVRFELDYTAAGGAPELLAGDIQLLSARLIAGGLSNIKMHTEATDDKTFLVFTFPHYISEQSAELMARLLTAPGQVDIWKDAGAEGEADPNLSSFFLAQLQPDYKAIKADVSISDIESIGVETRSNLQSNDGTLIQSPVWRLIFKQDSVDRLNTAVGAGSSPIYLAIDGEPVFILRSVPEYDNQGQIARLAGKEAIAIPLFSGDFGEVKVQSTYLTIGGNLFGQFTFVSITEVGPNYADSGRTFLAVTMVLGQLQVGLYIYNQLKATSLARRSKALIVWAYGLYMLIAVALMKFGAAPISLGMLIAFVPASIVGVEAILQLANARSLEQFNKFNTQIRNISLVTFVMAWLILGSGLSFGILTDILVALAVFSLALLLSTLLTFRAVFSKIIN